MTPRPTALSMTWRGAPSMRARRCWVREGKSSPTGPHWSQFYATNSVEEVSAMSGKLVTFSVLTAIASTARRPKSLPPKRNAAVVTNRCSRGTHSRFQPRASRRTCSTMMFRWWSISGRHGAGPARRWPPSTNASPPNGSSTSASSRWTPKRSRISRPFHIRSIRLLMLFHKGSVVAQHAGAVDAQTLRSWLRAHAELPWASRVPQDRVS